MLLVPRVSSSTRGSLLLAAIPLACMVIHRALSELETVIAERLEHLAGLETRIAAREAALGVYETATPRDAEGTKDVDDDAAVPTAPVASCVAKGCDQRTQAGWYCPDHAYMDPTTEPATTG